MILVDSSVWIENQITLLHNYRDFDPFANYLGLSAIPRDVHLQ